MNAKYVNGMPLARQEREFARYDLNLSTKTMANWIISCADRYLGLLYRQMKEEFLKNSWKKQLHIRQWRGSESCIKWRNWSKTRHRKDFEPKRRNKMCRPMGGVFYNQGTDDYVLTSLQLDYWQYITILFSFYFPQHFLYFFPLPHGHGSFLPTFGVSLWYGISLCIPAKGFP